MTGTFSRDQLTADLSKTAGSSINISKLFQQTTGQEQNYWVAVVKVADTTGYIQGLVGVLAADDVAATSLQAEVQRTLELLGLDVARNTIDLTIPESSSALTRLQATYSACCSVTTSGAYSMKQR